MSDVDLVAEIPSPSWSGFSIGPLTIHAYALCILAGILLALWLTSRRWRARGGHEDDLWNIAIITVPAGIIGGRLYHIFSTPDPYFGPNGNPLDALKIWNGGLGIWGAVALGMLAAWAVARYQGIRILPFLDAAAPGLILAQAVGRWGNWFNQELFGGPTTAPWGLRVDADHPNFPAGVPADTLFHPTFLYESLWNLLGVAVLLLVDRRWRLRHGAMVWAYVAWYTAGRVWIEMLRIDDAELVTLFGVTQRLNVWTSIVMLLLALVMLAVILVKHGPAAAGPRSDDSVWLPGRGPALEAGAGAPVDAAVAGQGPDDGAGSTAAGVREDR